MRNTAYLLGLALTAGLISTVVAHDPPIPPAQPPGNAAPGSVQELMGRLTSDLADFQEDITVEVPGPRGHDLYKQAGTVLDEATHLQNALPTKPSREHIQKHMAELDQDLRKLLDGVAALEPQVKILQRSAARINALEQQLYAALAPPVDTSGDKGQDVIARQMHLLASQAQDFNKAVQYVAQNNPDAHQLADDAGEFAEAVEHFHKGLDSGFNPDHLHRDFGKVNDAWGKTIADLQTFPRQGNRAVFVKAGQVSAVYASLFQQLKIEGERVQLKDRD